MRPLAAGIVATHAFGLSPERKPRRTVKISDVRRTQTRFGDLALPADATHGSLTLSA